MGLKKKWFDGGLPFLIGYVPSDLDKDIVKTKGGSDTIHYESVTGDRILKDTQVSIANYYMGGALIILGLVSYILTKGNFLSGPLVAFGIGSLLCLYAFLVPKKEIILNRMEGLITYPDWFFLKSHTRPFKDIKAFWTSTGGASGALGQRLVTTPPNSKRAIDLRMHPGLFDHSWSLIVWYMDKNRPLPPGSAYDEYREKDFERRKAEGFPPPLFPSRFPILEATPEQQAERDKYWRDEDHFGSSDTAWY